MRVDMTQKWIVKVTGEAFEAPAEDLLEASDGAAVLCRSAMPYDGQEHLVAVAMDCHGTPLAITRIASGSVDNCPLYARDVYAWALSVPRVRFIGLAHNHPSGDVDPSDTDSQGSSALAKAGKLLGLGLRWSIVVTHESDLWAIVPIKEDKDKGRDSGGDDAEPSRPQDPDEGDDESDGPGDGPVDGDKPKPDKPAPDKPAPDKPATAAATTDKPATTEDELRRAVAKVFGVRTRK